MSILCFLGPCSAVWALNENSSVAPSAQQPPPLLWPNEMPLAVKSPLLDLLQTISGRKPEDKTMRLLSGVVEIHTTQTGVRFIRSDSEFLDWTSDTISGARFINNWQDTAQQAGNFFGPEAAAFMMGLHSIKAKGTVVEVEDTMHDCLLRFAQHQKSKFLCLESLRLKDIRLSVERERGQLWIKHVEGVEASLRVGQLKIPLQLREFSRKKNINGQTVLTFGFIPSTFSPLRALLEPYRVSFIVENHHQEHSD